MKNIRIIRLTLDNFKCHRHLTLDFAGESHSVYGDNATGKTSVYDALTWLLFGKDSAGNGEKNMEIKPLDSTGSVADHDAITSVEAELSVDGEPITLKRTFREIWASKRGASEESFTGNTSEYFVDGVPCKKYVFEDKIKEIVPEDVFHTLTTVSYFPNDLDWRKRRSILFDMAGTSTDRDIMATDPRFAPLLSGMGRLSLDDYRKKLAAEKKGFLGVKDQTPARLDECQREIRNASGLDFAGVRAALMDLEQRKEELSGRLLALEHNTAVENKRLEIREAELEQRRLDSENGAFRAKQTVSNVDTGSMKRQLSALTSQKDSASRQIKTYQNQIESLERKIDESRARWVSVNGETFSGGTCPTCGQTLPTAQLAAAKESFEAQKRFRLDEISRAAGSQKESRESAEEQMKHLMDELPALDAEIRSISAEIRKAESAKITPTDMDGYAEASQAIRERIQALKKELDGIAGGSFMERVGIQNELDTVRKQIADANGIIAQERVLDYNRKRVEEIQADARNAASALEAITKMIVLSEEYIRYKTKFVESSVNGLFRIARFRLFREQANGGVEDRCDVVFDGVPYMSLNNGMKINVGIDIINRLSEHYGVRVPLFIDNAESVTKLEESGTQVIRLVVSENDKELRMV